MSTETMILLEIAMGFLVHKGRILVFGCLNFLY